MVAPRDDDLAALRAQVQELKDALLRETESPGREAAAISSSVATGCFELFLFPCQTQCPSALRRDYALDGVRYVLP